MTEMFLLDTNAYFLLIEGKTSDAYERLKDRLKTADIISFYISEITSFEIYSVLGKVRRGSPKQIAKCDREIIMEDGITTCSNRWIYQGKKAIARRLFHDFQKLINDIEKMRGDIQATILEIDKASTMQAKRLLLLYSDRYSFGSHDALICGSVISAKKNKKLDLTVVTSDRGFKAVLLEENIPFFDPRKY